MQATYETFGCNDGNVFLIGIDKGNSNNAVLYFDSVYGVHYPDVSGNDGSGNLAHQLYNVEATPTIVIINPDRSIAVKQIYPPSQTSVSDSIFSHGGIQQECLTAIIEKPAEEILLVSPNPVNGSANIHFSLEKRSDVELIIYDLSGRIVWQSHPGNYEAGKFYIEMDLSGAEKGFYHVQLKLNGKEVAIQKLIKI